MLTIQRNMLIGVGWTLQAILGTTTLVSGLACTATSPASMFVNVGTGEIFALQSLDTTAYSSLAADTTAAHQIVKQGLNLSTQTLPCPAPSTAGYSQVYLIQAGYSDYDTNAAVSQYFNSTNPTQPFTGPNNTGTSQPTTRQGLCSVQVKPGTAASTGTQTTPTPDAGYVGLYAVTVPYGATTITASNIAIVTGAPFLTQTLPQLIAAVSTLQSNSGVPNVSAFSSTGSFTVPNGCTAVEIEVWGGGGGGGGGYYAGGAAYNGAGGSGAGYSRGRFTVTPGQVYAVTVGAGGAGGSGGTTTSPGTSGGGTSFGSLITATGGGGGGNSSASANASAVGTPGSGSGGYFSQPGQYGSLGSSASYNGFGGAAFGGYPTGPFVGGGTSATSVGGGGGGGDGTMGGNGAAGFVIVKHLP